ncbi:MAG TPA: acyl-CoA dehydrogenase family protein [Capsulimonadaceae bacterium]|nr:acyl-CoA dehydrogenase family protein [Capsulimonadaceae bacterium]
MDRELLRQAWRIADDLLRPCASAADRGAIDGPVKSNIHALAELGFLGLSVPAQYGGFDADEATRHEYTEILASACGVTAFTQHQLQTAALHISLSPNESLKGGVLPEIAAGRTLCGVALSHLRRAGDCCLSAEPAEGGYLVNGTIPWISGWGLIDSFVFGASLRETGEHLFAYVDIANAKDSLRAGEPVELVVMNASGTVEVQVENLFVSDDCVLNIQPAELFHQYDHKMITSHTALPLGCARAAAAYLRELGDKQEREELVSLAIAVSYETDQCRREALTWNCDCVEHPEYDSYALRARAQSIVLALRAAHAAVTVTGGRAHLTHSTAQRLLREAQFYTTVVQTPGVQSSTLDQLFSPLFGQ